MSLAEGTVVTCAKRNRRGGLKRLWLAERTEISSFTTGTSHEYTDVTLDSTNFKLFEFEKFTGQDGSEGSKENGSDTQSVSMEFQIPKQEKITAERLNALKQSCDLVAIYEDQNGLFWVDGWDEVIGEDAALTATVNEVRGVELNSENHYLLTLEGMRADLRREFTGDTTNANKFEQP